MEPVSPSPKVSVIMSVYNGERYLRESIESILNQKLEDLEFVIINDGSTDNTANILDEYSKKDQRVRVINNKENIGLTISLNIGIEAARGEYIARQDADDMSYPERLEKQYLAAQQTGTDIVGARASRSLDDEQEIIPKSIYLKNTSFASLRFGNLFIHGTLFFRAALLKAARYDEAYKYAQDYELMLRLLKAGKKVFVINEPLYYLRTQEESMTRNNRVEQLECAREICRKYFGTAFFHIDEENYLRNRMLVLLRRLRACL